MSAPPLTPAVAGERRETGRRAGRLSYYVAGDGAPVLLVHSINAAASAYEVRPVHEALRARYRCYAVDLPGYGFSDRSRRRYDIRLFTDAIHDMLEVIGEAEGASPVHVLAVSLSSEFAARALAEHPGRARSLALVTPTGFGRAYKAGVAGRKATREVSGLHGALTVPVWREGLYGLLVSRASIRYFLQRTFGAKEIDEGLWRYCHLTAHQPGASNAPYAFLSGRLFTGDVRAIYAPLDLPVWVPHATRGDFCDFTAADWARGLPNWHFQPMAAGALPYFERPAEFLASYQQFLDEYEAAAQPRSSGTPSISP